MSALSHRARVAALTRHHPDNPEFVTSARRDLAAAKLEDYVRRTVDKAPPLTPEQRDRIAAALWSGSPLTEAGAA